jgi:excisionase family DNA binding protein
MMFLTISELTEMLSLPKSFVYEHTRKGSIDPIPGAFRFGKHLRFKREDIDKWIEKHRKK